MTTEQLPFPGLRSGVEGVPTVEEGVGQGKSENLRLGARRDSAENAGMVQG